MMFLLLKNEHRKICTVCLDISHNFAIFQKCLLETIVFFKALQTWTQTYGQNVDPVFFQEEIFSRGPGEECSVSLLLKHPVTFTV